MNRVTCTLWGLALVVTFSSCGEHEPLAPSSSLTANASGRFPIVYVTTRLPQATNASAPLVASLSAAVALVRPGGTIFVEEGEWDVSGVVINKPLTLTAARRAEPLLANRGSGEGLTIDGVAEGTVEIRGLRFLNAAGLSAVHVRGTYDRVAIRDSRFEVTAEPVERAGFAYGLRVTTSSVPDGEVLVENSTFEGGRIGVWTEDARVHVRRSSFSRHFLASVQHIRGSRGSIVGNEVVGCGRNACIIVFDTDAMVIANNRLSHPLDTARNGIAAWETAGSPFSVTITGNELLGIGVQPDDLDPLDVDGPNRPWGRPTNASAFRAGILVDGRISALVSSNRVSGAHWGINFFDGPSGTISSNTVENCGAQCISVFLAGAATVIEHNVVSGDVGFRRANNAIIVATQEPEARVRVSSNRILGTYNGGDPRDFMSYAFRTGIMAISWSPFSARAPAGVPGTEVEVYDNWVTNVAEGLLAGDGGFMTAHDNVLRGMSRGVASGGALTRMRAHRNDILEAAVAVSGGGDIDARCNWWGSPSGPGTAHVPAEVYTPWATEPIANRPLVECG